MKATLITNQPKRLFAFGCSFTEYAWTTWPQILAREFDIPLYNYGKSGAGNQYIFNMLVQANKYYKFNSNDLVMISWTNVNREDRYIKGRWNTPGTIHVNSWYDEKYIEKYVDPLGYLIRDLASIDSAYYLLKQTECQLHMMSMSNFLDSYAQFYVKKFKEPQKVEELKKFYKDSIEKILPSFYQILWGGTLDLKVKQEMEMFGKFFADRHPHPKEHLAYLENVFDYDIKEETKSALDKVYARWYDLCYSLSRDKKFLVYYLDKPILENFLIECRLVESEKCFRL